MSDPLVPLEEQLFDTSYEYDFFQAVKLLHLMLDDRPGIARADSAPTIAWRASIESCPDTGSPSYYTVESIADEFFPESWLIPVA